jgi:hypothetical protein
LFDESRAECNRRVLGPRQLAVDLNDEILEGIALEGLIPGGTASEAIAHPLGDVATIVLTQVRWFAYGARLIVTQDVTLVDTALQSTFGHRDPTEESHRSRQACGILDTQQKGAPSEFSESLVRTTRHAVADAFAIEHDAGERVRREDSLRLNTRFSRHTFGED